MYKVFINDKPLVIAGSDEQTGIWAELPEKAFSGLEQLLELKKELEPDGQALGFVVRTADPEQAWDQWMNAHKLVRAAGGLVSNAKGSTLMIFRLNRWDLPKGKVEKGESVDQAALREVEEECGISQLKLGSLLLTTYHTYTHKGKAVLKETFWYRMVSSDPKHPVPQQEEGISKVEWMNSESLQNAMHNTWQTIRDVVLKGEES